MSAKVQVVTPDVALKQVLELAESLGYSLGVVALTPKTRTPIPIIEYLPDGVELQIVMVKRDLSNTNGHNSLLPA